MAVLKSYTCSKCAGILIFDSDQEFFDCPFCGTRFSSVDFHGKELSSQADACLERREFSAAKEKYKAILSEDSRNFNALRGMLLSTIMVSSEKELSDISKLKKANLNRIRNELDTARDFSGKKNWEYFNVISNMTEHVEELKQIEKIHDEMESERSKKLMDNASKTLDSSSGSVFSPYLIRVLVMLGVLVTLTIPFFIFAHDDPDAIWDMVKFLMIPAAFVLLAVAVSVGGAGYHKTLKSKVENTELKKNRIDSEIEWHEDAYMNQYKKLIAIEPETEEDTESSETGTKVEDYGSHKLSEKTIQCAKCGAGLSLDMEKRVYECGSCGVAYGISLFFGLPHEKALNSMNMGFFDEADKRFSHILMAEQSDFESLLGRILCAGRWTKVSDVCVSDVLTPTRLRHTHDRLLKAVSDSEEQDKEYFECLKDYIDVLEALAINKHKQMVINKELDAVRTKIEVYSEFYDMEESTRAEREEIMSRLQPFQNAAPGLNRAFDEARSKIIAMARDSVLTK